MMKLPKLKEWTSASNYGGDHSQDEWYVAAVRTRDSKILEVSNYEAVKAALGDLDGWEEIRHGHWAVGWIDLVVIRPDATEAIKKAVELECQLAEYPILDEEDYYDRLSEYAQDTWESMALWERVEMCQEGRISIFAARREEYPPDLHDRLTTDQ